MALATPWSRRGGPLRPGELILTLHHWEDHRGEPVSYMLSVQTGDVLHQIDTGFDPATAAASPGLLATFDSVRWACDQGLHMVDMGIAANYKGRFAPDIEIGRGVDLSRGLMGRIMRARS